MIPIILPYITALRRIDSGSYAPAKPGIRLQDTGKSLCTKIGHMGYGEDRAVLFRVSLRVHVPNNWVLRVLVIVIAVQVLGKYMIIRYLDP